MGREYRLPRNPGLREEGDRREAGVSTAVWRQIQRGGVPVDRVVAGIDVGEDYLDLAVINPGRRALELAQVDLRGIERAPQGSNAEFTRRISRAAPTLRPGAIAVVDSPRWPVDLDWACALDGARVVPPARRVTRRTAPPRGRAIDELLRGLVGDLRAAGASQLRLSMFPTPPLTYFTAQIESPTCKPHLRALGRALFGRDSLVGPARGGTFTRFMLTGFATYVALTRLQVTAYEGFPDLQFRLWSGNRALPSKTGTKRTGAGRAAALDARRGLVGKLAARLKVEGGAAVRTLDQADAAILALSVVAASTADCGTVVAHPAEGSFWLTLPAILARLIPCPGD